MIYNVFNIQWREWSKVKQNTTLYAFYLHWMTERKPIIFMKSEKLWKVHKGKQLQCVGLHINTYKLQ